MFSCERLRLRCYLPTPNKPCELSQSSAPVSIQELRAALCGPQHFIELGNERDLVRNDVKLVKWVNTPQHLPCFCRSNSVSGCVLHRHHAKRFRESGQFLFWAMLIMRFAACPAPFVYTVGGMEEAICQSVLNISILGIAINLPCMFFPFHALD